MALEVRGVTSNSEQIDLEFNAGNNVVYTVFVKAEW